MTIKRGVIIAALSLSLLLLAGIFYFVSDSPESAFLDPSPVDKSQPAHPSGGTVRIAVTSPPEMPDRSNGGDVLRQLVLPSLFIAQPDGSWRASLVEPGTDRTAKDATSAQFRLRDHALWSDGTTISAEDLRRTADSRFVSAIEGPDASGLTTVRFTHPLPGWRRLWSGQDAISQPRPDVYAGPFRVASVESGFRTALVRNDKWWGKAFLDKIELVLVADTAMGYALLAQGAIDVYEPPADTVRTPKLKRMDGVSVSRSDRSGAWAAIRLHETHLSEPDRKTIAAKFPREEFVGSLLADEATLIDSISGLRDGGAKPEAEKALVVKSFATHTPSSQPLSSLFGKALQRSVETVGTTTTATMQSDDELRTRLQKGEYDALLEVGNDGPDVCWQCHFSVDPELAKKADAGDKNATMQLEKRLYEAALVLPLWRPAAVAGYRTSVVDGVAANGYVNGIAWNADRWWKP